MDLMQESYLGLTTSLALLVISTLVVYYVFALIGECFKCLMVRKKGEVYTFHFPNPLKKIYTDIQNFKNWLQLKKQQINTVIQVLTDLKWFFLKNIEEDKKTKHAFITYSGIVFCCGAIFSDIYDYVMKFDLFSIIIKAFQ